jgi:aryl-alcohol dehydrogenase-like predicted oxidoreductase
VSELCLGAMMCGWWGEAFVLRHPAVTSVIIGAAHDGALESQLPAADVTLSEDVRTASTRSCRPASR